MKRYITLMMILLFFTIFPACGKSISQQTNFYYRTAEYHFGNNASVIQAETREISGHDGELSYLISLYLAGASNKQLESPFPRNTKLVSVEANDSCIKIELSYLGKQLSDADFTLACACLALTAMEFSEASQVTITSGSNTITMDKNDIHLLDTVTSNTAMEGNS